MDILQNITPAMLDGLTVEKRSEINKLLKEIKERRLKYPLLDVKFHDYQQEFDDAIKARNEDGTPRWKFIVFLGGNGSGKTWYASTVTIRKAMGTELCKKYGIPPVGNASLIKMYTTTGDNIRDNIDRKYLLGTGTGTDKMKFPGYINKDNKGEVIKSTRHDKEILKEIKLKNGSVITFGTYDQGQARLQGGEPDFTWMDELPTRFEDLIEIWRGTRNANGQLLISATPTNYNKKIHDYIFNEKFKDVMFIKQIDSFRNTDADHSWMEGLTEEDIKKRRFGSFTPPAGLVYPNFNREHNIIPHFHPKELGSGTTYYGGLDFGQVHPTAFLFIAVDNDGHYYVFDYIYKKQLLAKDLANEIKKKCNEWGITLKNIFADSAGASERNELKAEGIKTKGVNKKRKINKTSFTIGSTMRMNQMLSLGKIIISDKCTPLIDELEVHSYKENGDVNKIDDDAIDALRYMISEHQAPQESKELKKRRKKIARKAQKGRRY